MKLLRFLLLTGPASVLLPVLAAAETWVTSKGGMFEASVQKVTPGQATFLLKDGSEQTLPLSELSERSRAKLAEILGLGTAQVQPAAEAAATTEPPAAAPAMAALTATQPADGSAIDVTDRAQIDARMGQPAIVVGTVSEVVKLGTAGHRLLKFEGSPFSVFISKQALDASTDWILDDLPGKRLQVSGKLEVYRDAPQIRGNEPSQLVRVQ